MMASWLVGKLKWWCEDGEGDPQVSLRKYRQVVLNNDVDFIIAGDSSAVPYALRDEIEKDPKIMFVPISAALDISWEQKSEYIFRFGIFELARGQRQRENMLLTISVKRRSPLPPIILVVKRYNHLRLHMKTTVAKL